MSAEVEDEFEQFRHLLLGAVRKVADSKDPRVAFAKSLGDRPMAGPASYWRGFPTLAMILLELGDHGTDDERAARLLMVTCNEIPVLAASNRLERPDVAGAAVGIAAFRRAHPSTFASASTFLNAQLVRAMDEFAAKVEASVAQNSHCHSFIEYDIIQGGASLVLAARAASIDDASHLEDVLASLVAFPEDHRPRWQVPHAPLIDVDASQQRVGAHTNIGMAHGFLGILAALAQSGEAMRRDAARAIADWSAVWGEVSSSRVPEIMTAARRPEVLVSSPPGSWSWCYGTVGWANVMHALLPDDRAWERLVDDTLRDALPVMARDGVSFGLCHGAAGLYLLPGLTGSDVGQVDRLVADSLTRNLEEAGGGTEDLVAGPELVSLLLGLGGVLMGRELARQERSRTRWELLIGVGERARRREPSLAS